MSRQVTVDFEGVSITIQSQCEAAANSLCKIDKVINRIHETASTLETQKVKEYQNYLLESKQKIQNAISEFTASLEEYKALKQQTIFEYALDSNDDGDDVSKQFNKLNTTLRQKGEELVNMVNELTGSKLEVIDQMIHEGLLNTGQESVQAMMDKANGVLNISADMTSKIDEIEDVSLRELTYREMLKQANEGLSFEELVSKAQEEYDILVGKKTRQVIEEYKAELKANGVSPEVLNSAKSIDEANATMNAAIIDEKVRKETLKVIIKTIKDRGFVVDTKKNLKIDKDKNIVKLVALKASGQTAEFEIQLNGKFMYRFDGYEGLACNKDIDPFMEDLKNVYDINILHEENQWSNPDKIQTQKYQYVNKNKNTN
ncbi:MAG: hypothetical protein HUJ42_00850 [Malacoplasma sp.]|nr:hypothetical protein [Malacoplasma sp.]